MGRKLLPLGIDNGSRFVKYRALDSIKLGTCMVTYMHIIRVNY